MFNLYEYLSNISYGSDTYKVRVHKTMVWSALSGGVPLYGRAVASEPVLTDYGYATVSLAIAALHFHLRSNQI